MAVVVGGWLGLTRSQVFAVREIKVEGIEQLTTDEVLATASVDEDATLLRVDTDAVVSRVRQLAWVEDVRVSRVFPSTLRIVVEERVPVLLVDTGVTFWFVDGQTRVIAESSPTTGTVLPVVRDLPDFAAEPGVISDSQSLRNAIAVLDGITDDLAATVRVVTAPSVNETTLLTVSGVEIMIGEAVQLEQKSALIKDILAEREGQVVFIDVRSVDRPISRGIGQ